MKTLSLKCQIIACLLGSFMMRTFSECFKDENSFKKSAEYTHKYDWCIFSCFLILKYYSNWSRYFEILAIKILNLFDKNESDFFNDNLLLTRNDNFCVHILNLANSAKCEKFMATNCAQKTLDEIWNNGILFSHDKKIRFSRRFHSIKVTLFFFSL